jgi:hypothetical protein
MDHEVWGSGCDRKKIDIDQFFSGKNSPAVRGSPAEQNEFIMKIMPQIG